MDSQKNTHEDANITQIFAMLFTVFLTYMTVTNAGVHWGTAACLAGIMGAYYLGVCWNHTSGITAKPKNTFTALVFAAFLTGLLMVVGLPLVLANFLFWAIFPWTQRYFFAKEKDPKIPPPKNVDVDQA